MSDTFNPSWGCALSDIRQCDLPKTVLKKDIVIRQIITLSSGGSGLRLELSNLYGKKPLDITAAHIARPAQEGIVDSKIDISTETALAFDGKSSVAIPPGESVYSDLLILKTKPRDKLVITIRLGGSVPYQPDDNSSQVTGHAGARTSTYISKDADVSAVSMKADERIESWYYISGIDIMQTEASHTIVCFGDSITDGYGAVTNKDTRWSDYLSEMIKENGMADRYSVINRGIGGNSVATGGIGEQGIKRFDSDATGTLNAEYILVLEGINDIGGITDVVEGEKRTDKVIDGFKGFIEKAHAKGIKIYGATITPVGGHDYYTEVEEMCRNRINDWIKANTNTVKAGEDGYDADKYDGYLDFEALLADPADPTKFLAEYSTDCLHPSPAGYEEMGQYAFKAMFN